MTMVTGPGPFRHIPDNELRPTFYLTPQKTYLFEFFPIMSNPPPGTNDARVTALLRRMLYVRRIDPPTLRQLAEDIRAFQSDREMIAISAKLLSLMGQAFERPWGLPALLATHDILKLRKAFSGVTDVTSVPANITSSTPAAYALSFLARFAGTAVSHATYMAALTNKHYDFYLQKMNTELNLRGINASLLQ